ncbi:unnamed protein product [Absidia cylindrospora]
MNTYPLFAIRRCTDVDEVCHYFLTWPVEEGWNHCYGAEEIRQVFYPCDPNGFFLGTLMNENGQETVVATILTLRHTDDLAWIGSFIVAKNHRGKGYGSKLFQHGMNYLKGCRCIGLESLPTVVPNYRRLGFDGWTSKTFRGDMIKNVLEKLDAKKYEDVCIMDWTDTDNGNLDQLEQLIVLEKRTTGYDRPNFWKRWIRLHSSNGANGTQAASYGRYAVTVPNSSGGIGHFALIRPVVYGFSITIFSDSIHVAKALLRYLVQRVVEAACDPSSKWLLPKDHPLDVNGNVCSLNPVSVALFQDLGFEYVSSRERMFYGTPPDADLSGLFSVATLTVG